MDLLQNCNTQTFIIPHASKCNHLSTRSGLYSGLNLHSAAKSHGYHYL